MDLTWMTVDINADDDAMVGGEGWGNHDAAASIDRFEDAVLARLTQAFPGVEITVTTKVDLYATKVQTDGTPSEEDEVREHVLRLIEEVWQSWSWLVEA